MRRVALAPVILSVLVAAGCESGSSPSGYTFTTPPPALTTTVRPAPVPTRSATTRPYAVPTPRVVVGPPVVSPTLSAPPPAARPASASMTTTTVVRPGATSAARSFTPASPRPAAAPSTTVLANDQTFDRELASATTPVIVTFTAKWCGPCHAAAPVLDALAVEQAGRVKVIRIDFDQSPQVVRRYGISAIPAVLVVKNGVITQRKVGYQSRENLMAAVGD
jgi:thioredoxin 1